MLTQVTRLASDTWNLGSTLCFILLPLWSAVILGCPGLVVGSPVSKASPWAGLGPSIARL